MMEVGTDIVETARIAKAMNERFLDLVLSSEEKEYAKDFSEKRLVEFTAGRFAAKEAIIKAISGYETPVMSELNIVNNEQGRPEIKYKDYRIALSIAHEKSYAVAVAILEVD